jgi:hypothetical protein
MSNEDDSKYFNNNNEENINNLSNIESENNRTVDDSKKTIDLFIHLTIITELIKKINGETKCICHNLIIPQNTKESLINNSFLINENNTLIPKIEPIKDNINNNVFFETEIIPIMTVPLLSEDKILFNSIISNLKLLGYPVVGSLFSIYLKNVDDYVYVGTEPLDDNFYISKDDVDFDCIKIKMVSYLEDKYIKKTEKQLFEKKDNKNKIKDKRTKERRIGFIVEKVNAWRKLYNGFYNEKGEHIRYSLDQAAKIIDVSKKSLDDYLLQLRLGRKYGFDFNLNKNNKVGVLRAFVKKHRIKGGDAKENDN